MRATVGYCDNPDAALAGKRAATLALEKDGLRDKCDFVLLFSTSRHDPRILREAVASVVGETVPIYGGGASGAISNDEFGYDGAQDTLALFWLEGVKDDFIIQGGLADTDYLAGFSLCRTWPARGTCAAPRGRRLSVVLSRVVERVRQCVASRVRAA